MDLHFFSNKQSLKKEIKENFTLKTDEEIKSFNVSVTEEPAQIPEENEEKTVRAAELVQESIIQPNESCVKTYLNKYQIVKPCSIKRDRIKLALKPQNQNQTPPPAISFKHDFHNFLERHNQKPPPPE